MAYLAHKLNNLKLNNYIAYNYIITLLLCSWSYKSWMDFSPFDWYYEACFEKEQSDMLLTRLNYTLCQAVWFLTQSTDKTFTY